MPTTHLDEAEYRLKDDLADVLAWEGWPSDMYSMTRIDCAKVAWIVNLLGPFESNNAVADFVEAAETWFGWRVTKTIKNGHLPKMSGTMRTSHSSLAWPTLLDRLVDGKRTLYLGVRDGVDLPPNPWVHHGPELLHTPDRNGQGVAVTEPAAEPEKPTEVPMPTDPRPVAVELVPSSSTVGDKAVLIMRLAGEIFRDHTTAYAPVPDYPDLRTELTQAVKNLEAEQARHENTRKALASASSALREAEAAVLRLDANLQAVLRGERVEDMRGMKVLQDLMTKREPK
jgi:hypothetical protein